MLHHVQHDCQKNERSFVILRPSVTSEGHMLLLPQNEALVSIIQDEDSQHTKYDGVHWTFSLEIHDRVIKKLRKASMAVSSAVCRYITEVFSISKHKHASLDYSVRRRLYDFQALAVEKAFEVQGRILLGDASGMGKKYQALAIASCFRGRKPILIVCNSIRTSTWQTLAREILGMDISIVGKISELDDGSSITDHSLIAKYCNKFSCIQYGLMIIDDSHVLLNKTSHIEKCCRAMLKKVERVILVTTVARHMSISEWFIVFSIIFGSRFITFDSYRKRYPDFSDELKCLINRVSFIRDRSNLLGRALGMDNKINNTEHGKYPSNVPLIHRRVIDCCSAHLKRSRITLEKWSRELRSRYKREIRHKYKTIRTYLEYLLRKGLRVALVVHFRSTIRALLKHAPIARQVVLDGTHKEMDGVQCTQFNTGNTPVVLVTYKALKTCSFLRVDTVCIAELHLKTECVSRAESVSGQRIMADVHYLIEKGGVERCLWENIKSRLEM